MNKMNEFIIEYSLACVQCVQSGDIQTFTGLLNEFNFSESDPDVVEKFFIDLLLMSSPEFIRVIIDKWIKFVTEDFVVLDGESAKVKTRTETFPGVEIYLSCRLYAYPHTLNSVLELINNTTSFYDMFYPYIIRNVNDSTTGLVCCAIDRCFNPTYEEYKAVYDSAEPFNAEVARYMQRRMVAVGKYSGIPNYIARGHLSDLPLNEIVKRLQPGDSPNLSKQELIKHIIEREKIYFNLCDDDKCSLNEAKADAMKLLNQNPEQVDKLSKLIHLEKHSADNEDIQYKYFGLSNPSDEEVMDGESICTSFGGCRMLLCVCYDQIDESDVVDPSPDWFTGYCLECNNMIRCRSHALRLPMPGGGWRHCFCKFRCVKRHIESLPGCFTSDVLKMYSILRQMQLYLRQNKIFDSKHEFVENEKCDFAAPGKTFTGVNRASIDSNVPVEHEEEDIGLYECHQKNELDDIDLEPGIEFEKSNYELEIEKECTELAQSLETNSVFDI